jgi:serine/threonine-protein kinase
VSTIIGNSYLIDSRLGTGGGAVFKAWHIRLQKYVVLKEAKCFPGKSFTVYRNESEALKNVKSRYLPQVFDFVADKERVYTVMEYIDGENFDTLMQNGCTFTESETLKWYRQLADALVTLHSQGIFHRDIKPANIMLTQSGDVCLIDFDSAFVGGKAAGFVSRSPGYAPPEQYEIFDRIKDAGDIPWSLIMAAEAIDWKRADIYSLGATMYHILTGRRPHERASMSVTVSNSGRFNAGLLYIIEKSMKPEPSERFASMHPIIALCGVLW